MVAFAIYFCSTFYFSRKPTLIKWPKEVLPLYRSERSIDKTGFEAKRRQLILQVFGTTERL